MRNRLRRLLAWFSVPAMATSLVLGAASCYGQLGGPTGPAIFFIFPASGQLGKTVEATVAGQQLKGATAVYISGKGLSARVASAEKPDPNAKPKPGPPAPPPRQFPLPEPRTSSLWPPCPQVSTRPRGPRPTRATPLPASSR